jgi:hypothetical protein
MIGVPADFTPGRAVTGGRELAWPARVRWPLGGRRARPGVSA